MWHLQVYQKQTDFVDFSYLFHTLDDVSRYVLNASQLYDYRLVFIPIYLTDRNTAQPLQSEAGDVPFTFPEPLSGEGQA